MAYSKIILNGETLMDVTSDTVDADGLVDGVTATKNDGTKVEGTILPLYQSGLVVDGRKVTVPAGYYTFNDTSINVSSTTHPNPTAAIASSTGVVTAQHVQGTGYVTGGTTTGTLNLTTQAAQTINTSTADQTIASNRWLTGTQTIKSVTTTNLTAANIAEGVIVKVGDANNASRITQITGTHSGGIEHTATINGAGNSTYCYVQHNGTKYYTNGTTFTFKEGDTITFFVRGDSDSYITYGDGTIAEATSTAGVGYNYIALGDDLEIYFNYNGSAQQNSIAFYLVNISLENGQVTPTEQYQYVTPSSAYAMQVVTVNPISSTYVGTGVAKKSSNDTTFASATGTFTAPIGYYSAAATKTITTQAAQTIYPSTADQTIASYRWLTGTQTIKSVTTSNLTAANIASGVVVKVGDANNASRIAQVTGTYAPAVSSLTVTPTETAQTFNATGVYGYKPVTVNAISSTYVGSGVPLKSDTDVYLVSENARVVVPRGYYSNPVYFNMEAVYSKTITPTESIQTAVSSGYFTIGDIYVRAISSTYVGTGVARKSSADTTFTSTTGTFTAPVGYYSTAATKTLTTQAAQTIYPSTADKTIASYMWLTGTQTIKSVTTSNLTASNIVNGVVVKIGDTSNASRIAQVTGTYAGGEYYEAYRSIALNQTLVSSVMADFIEDLTSLRQGMFVNRDFSNANVWSFTNALTMSRHCFAWSPEKWYYTGLKSNTYIFPKVESIASHAFEYNMNLYSIEAPLASIVAENAFYHCSKLTTASFPSCTSIGFAAFSSCSCLTTASFPSCTSIGGDAFYYCSSLTTISFPICTTISNSVFYGCWKITTASFPSCTSIGGYTFYSCSGLTAISFPICTTIGNYAFQGCSALTTINFPVCTSIGYYAFQGCRALTTASFPSCTSINSGAFYACASLTTISFPVCTTIGSSAFGNCNALTTINFPFCTSISIYAFYNCSSLTTISFPFCTTIGSSAFGNCSSLTAVNFPVCASINSSAFYRCQNLTTASFPSCAFIGGSAFCYCYNLISLYLNSVSSVPSLTAGAFYQSPISTYSTSAGRYGSIFVPSSLYASFLTATEWSKFSSRFVSV